MPEFYVTFGARYRSEVHRTFASAHPDGWVTIEADSELAARATANKWLGPAWAFMYDEASKPDLATFPRGELRWVRAAGEATP